jgi:hypothetical protein
MNDTPASIEGQGPTAAGTVDEFDLAGLDEAFAAATGEDEYDALPDGNYQAVVDRVALKRSKTSGRKMLEWELRILGAEHAGRKLWKYTLLETPDNVAWAKKDFRRVGFDLEKLSHLPSRLDELLDITIEITKKTRGEYEDVYFRKRLSSTGGQTNAQAPRVF